MAYLITLLVPTAGAERLEALASIVTAHLAMHGRYERNDLGGGVRAGRLETSEETLAILKFTRADAGTDTPIVARKIETALRSALAPKRGERTGEASVYVSSDRRPEGNAERTP